MFRRPDRLQHRQGDCDRFLASRQPPAVIELAVELANVAKDRQQLLPVLAPPGGVEERLQEIGRRPRRRAEEVGQTQLARHRPMECGKRLGVPLAEVGAEFLFQVVAERAEKAAVILTTNLPFSEWTQVIPNARLCKALLDRITDRAHILETGTESYRFRRTAEKHKKGVKTN